MNAEERTDEILARCIEDINLDRDMLELAEYIVEQIKQAEQSAFEEGQREMRERAAVLSSHSKASADPIEIAFKIRALPLTPAKTSDTNV